MQTTHTTQHKNAPQTAGQSKFHPVIQRIFDKREMSPSDIKEFLSWDLKDLPDLTDMKDMDKASKRIIEAMANNEKIAIYGDYDVDGTTSCALLYHFFKMLGTEVGLIQPSRFIEGYGIHPPQIEKGHENGYKIMITVDCGITNNEAADKAKELGLDLIITDHHKDARDEMPDAFAIINPNRRDEPADSPRVSLAGVTVGFALAVKIRQDLIDSGREVASIYPLLQFAAIGTICDLAALNPMNLKIVRHGLKQVPTTKYPGIRAFFTPEERKRGFVPAEKLGFNIGPLINSKGRLDHPEKALNLLITDDDQKAFEFYSHLEISNKERKFIQAEVFNSARDQVLKTMDGSEHTVTIVYAPEWHEGVIGIVASKLVDAFKVPAIVFTDSGEKGIIKASARSAGGLNLFDCLKENEELFIKFGGHHAAAGLSMVKENLDAFKKNMQATVSSFPAIQRTVQSYYDLEITPEEVNPRLLKELELLEPYGMGNQKPIFKMKGFRLDSYDLLKDIHVRWNFSSIKDPSVRLKGISFNYIGKWGIVHPEELFNSQSIRGEELTAYFTLAVNHFNGNQYIQLMIERMEV
ncbi:single-stranded-DNA-specific exonuclease RecJ [Halobacteriovorax marinus]|mgnify:CR=1 FL=1|uniref:Single-stranded-DNA-specific exonuclease RecJ n=1 Tax=Halobacteriovorax marinus TaxID=97084 RepID=A0A1Y5FA48_9BACT|nr:single-stranded-DNA-specific exonuclease RecJ [Halobacteriovorax marinus]